MTQSGPLPWFRMYHEAVDDEKLRLLAFEDRWHYVAILCCKCKGILDSQSEPALRDRKISVKLGVHGRDLEEVKRRLMEAELINSDWQPLGWENRQYKSDHSTERVRKHRARQG